MTISIVADNKTIPVKHVEFSDGASNLQLLLPDDFVLPIRIVVLTIDTDTPVDSYLQEITLANSLIKSWLVPSSDTKSSFRTVLNLPYLPHGRADRVFQKGNDIPLHSFFTVVKDWFDEIILTDPHSDYVLTTFASEEWKFTVKPQHRCVMETIRDWSSDVVIIAPDEGAINKANALVDHLRIVKNLDFPVGFAKKERDLDSGRIKSIQLPPIDVKGKRCIIIDDIADGGGTFIPLADTLLSFGAARIDLYVTHGIFAKGLDVFKGVIDNIYVYQIIGNYITEKDLQSFNDIEHVDSDAFPQ